MTTAAAMTAPPVTVMLTSTIAEAAAAMREANASMLPVVDGASTLLLKGVLTDRDIIERCVSAQHAPGCLVRDHMTESPLETAAPTDEIEIVVKRMDTARVNRLPVVAPDGRVLGVITRRDVTTRALTEAQ